MSVKINGKILRNIPGEAEGIDTPSLLINGQPLSGGGTQLYKHSVTFDLDLSEEPLTVSGEFITASETSLVGKMFIGAGEFVSGMMTYNEYYCPVFYIDGYTIAYFDANSSEYTSISVTGNFLTDIVTAL